MYLKKVCIENIGSIEQLNIEMAFNNDNPKTTIIVGENGSGKSIFQSYIADALIELAKIHYKNIVNKEGAYFRLTGATNQRPASKYGLSLVEFIDNQSKIQYIEKTGNIDEVKLNNITSEYNLINNIDLNNNYKLIFGINDTKNVENIFQNNVLCYLPVNRNEKPHWLNINSLKEQEEVYTGKIFGHLYNDIIITTSSELNNKWILDVFLDSLVDIDMDIDNTGYVLKDNRVDDKLILKRGRNNIEDILKVILEDDSIYLSINYRNQGFSRISINNSNGILIPSLNHLSTGQSMLFNMFVTILRYADTNDINNTHKLNQIKGIVIIDEIDAHLHSKLLYEVLPKLIKLFPKIQFIISAHSPIFLLGMEKEFGEENYNIIEMPSGNSINVERFNEFMKSYEYYTKTKIFEESINNRLKINNKPLVLTEGETDPMYIKTALELLGKEDLINKIDIEWVGTYTSNGKGTLNSGDTGLNNTYNVFKANPLILKTKLMLLYDCDTNKKNTNENNIYIRKIEKNEDNDTCKKGIENLLPNSVFEKRFYKEITKVDDYGAKSVITSLDKIELCKYLCTEKRIKDDFNKFDSVISMIEEFSNL